MKTRTRKDGTKLWCISLWLDDDVYQRHEKAAKASDIKVSEYIRELLGAIEQAPIPSHKVRRQIMALYTQLGAMYRLLGTTEAWKKPKRGSVDVAIGDPPYSKAARPRAKAKPRPRR